MFKRALPFCAPVFKNLVLRAERLRAFCIPCSNESLSSLVFHARFSSLVAGIHGVLLSEGQCPESGHRGGRGHVVSADRRCPHEGSLDAFAESPDSQWRLGKVGDSLCGGQLLIGQALNVLLNSLIAGWALFLIVKAINRSQRMASAGMDRLRAEQGGDSEV